MEFENTLVMNFEGAFRGMRNPKESWNRSDSCFNSETTKLGIADKKLAQSLIKAGTDHSKFMRQIMVSVDITAPLYWWKEFDTYKVGTTANSTSTMHMLAKTSITLDKFKFDAVDTKTAINICERLESLRKEYLTTGNMWVWRSLIQLLPSSWLQTRTVTMSYQNVRSMYSARLSHKLFEWSVDFRKWAEALPLSKELIMYGLTLDDEESSDSAVYGGSNQSVKMPTSLMLGDIDKVLYQMA